MPRFAPGLDGNSMRDRRVGATRPFLARLSLRNRRPSGCERAVPFTDEFQWAGFGDARLLRTIPKARTRHSAVVAAEFAAVR